VNLEQGAKTAKVVRTENTVRGVFIVSPRGDSLPHPNGRPRQGFASLSRGGGLGSLLGAPPPCLAKLLGHECACEESAP
jgi:hypothetical protein